MRVIIRESILSCQSRVEQAHHSSSLRPRERSHYFRRCLILWTRSSPPKRRFRLQASGICVLVNDRNREEIFPNREGGTGNNMGIREIWNIRPRQDTVETNHKPLVPLLSTKHLDTLPARVLRFRLHLDRLEFAIMHVPGNHLYTADTLSCSPLTSTDCSTNLKELVELAAAAAVVHLPASPE